MNRFLYSIVFAILLISCAKDDVDGGSSKSSVGKVVNFGSGANATRTVYNYTDGTQVYWNPDSEKDTIRIYCAQAQVGKITGADSDGNITATVTNANTNGDVVWADYIVTRTSDDSAMGTIAPKNNNEVLIWGDGDHEFFSVYPADDDVKVTKEGVATFPINRDQHCYVMTAEELATDNKAAVDAGKIQEGAEYYDYVAKPNMNNAYMTANTTLSPTADKVWLAFDPVMTTLNIVVEGPEDSVENTTPSALITGVSVVSKTWSTDAIKGSFMFDLRSGNITANSKPTIDKNNTDTETTFATIMQNDLNGISLSEGESLCATIFLPPMAASTMSDLNREVSIRVHTTGGNKTLNLTLAQAQLMTPSDKGSIKLPPMYTPISGSNWITPLDGNILVSQLSIPGSHDAATGKGTSLMNAGQTQGLSIEDQWSLGVRCFDLRPAYYAPQTRRNIFSSWANSKDPSLHIFHGKTITDYSWDEAIQILLKAVQDNPGEFAIVLFRHESEQNNGTAQTSRNYKFIDEWPAQMGKYLYELAEKYPNNVCTDYTHDVTIDDLRGKILFITRDFYNYSLIDSPKHLKPIGAWASPWGDNNSYRENLLFNSEWNDGNTFPHDSVDDSYETNATTTNAATVYLQDMYKIESGQGETKKAAALTLLQKAAALNDPLEEGAKEKWALNHFSGYQMSGVESLFGAGIGESTDYLQNAANTNDAYRRYLLGQEVEANSQTFLRNKIGPTGIILMDWIGYDVWNDALLNNLFGTGNWLSTEYTTYGAVLTQTIIDNNYKYRMRRADE